MDVPQSFRSAFNGFNREDVVNYISYISTKHETQLGELNSELEQLREQLASNEEQGRIAATLKCGLEDAVVELNQTKAECDRLQSELQNRDEALQARDQEMDTLNLDLVNREEELEKVTLELTERDQTIEALRAACAEKEAEILRLQEALDQNALEFADLRKELEAARVLPAGNRKNDFFGRWAEELNAYRRAESCERRARERVNQMYDQAGSALAEASATVEQTAGQISELAAKVEADVALLLKAMVDSENTLADTAVMLGSIRPDME